MTTVDVAMIYKTVIVFITKFNNLCVKIVFAFTFSWKFLVYLISAEKWNEKREMPWWSSIFTFLLEYRFVWRQRFQKKICLKGIRCCSFHGSRNFAREKFLHGEHLTSSSTKTAERIKFKLCAHISYRLLTKPCPRFS